MTAATVATPPAPSARADIAFRVRRALPLVALGVFLVVAAALVTQPPSSGLPLDPRSTGADGTKALTMILQGVGADVTIVSAPPFDDFDTMAVLVDNLDDSTASQALAFADAGGVLLVTDPGGRITPRLRPAGASGGFTPALLDRGCDIDALRDVPMLRLRQAPLLKVPPGATSCYGRETLAWLVAQPRGAGVVIATGDQGWLTNGAIREEGYAALAVGLLAPEPGTRVGVLAPDFAAAGAAETTLGDLIPAGVKTAFVQLLVAFGLLVALRARRLGQPLAESQQVRLAGSELVLAVGRLLQRTGARERAAALLRADLRTALAMRLASGDDDPDRLAAAVAARTSVSVEDARTVLSGPAPANDAELVTLAQRAESLRRAALAVPGNRRNP